jgi:thiosulfate reductase cytochrome b subunit
MQADSLTRGTLVDAFGADSRPEPRHRTFVRLTHWMTALSTAALIVSGVGILLAHPRLYLGETGAFGGPAFMELPLPLVLGHSGWGRYLHFLAAWAAVVTGILYLMLGLATRHFSRNLFPPRADLTSGNLARVFGDHLSPTRIAAAAHGEYNVLQRIVYLTLVFIIGPVVLFSGLAFSPALVSAFPSLVNMFGGQQTARTIHFFGGAAVVLFVVVHLAMVSLTGFMDGIRSMTTGHVAREGKRS